jgi:hypothetical protein
MITKIADPEGQSTPSNATEFESGELHVKIKTCSKNPLDGDDLFFDDIEPLIIRM